MSDEAENVAILSEDDVPRGDSSQSQQQEITVDHTTNMSIHELLKVIKGANGMPVLFVPSSDGRIAAVAVDGLQTLLTTNSKDNGSAEKNQQDLRGWLLLVTSLAATITFAAGLNPPGGFWPADDKVNGYEAGTSVMRDKFHRKYLVFYCSNTTAFFSSLLIIIMLASNKSNPTMMLFKKRFFLFLVGLCFLSLGSSYVSGTRTSQGLLLYTGILFAGVLSYMVVCAMNTILSVPLSVPAVLQPYLYCDE